MTIAGWQGPKRGDEHTNELDARIPREPWPRIGDLVTIDGQQRRIIGFTDTGWKLGDPT